MLLPTPAQGDAGQPDFEAILWPVPQIRGSAMSDGRARLGASICRERGRPALGQPLKDGITQASFVRRSCEVQMQERTGVARLVRSSPGKRCSFPHKITSQVNQS